MGAHNFRHTVAHGKGKQMREPRKWVEETYKKLVDEALYEYGHSGYNGTISTTSGVRIRWIAPLSYEEARDFADKDLHKADKWGAAHAVFYYTRKSNKYPSGAIFYGWAAS